MEFFAHEAATGERLGAYRDATSDEIDAADEIMALGDPLIQNEQGSLQSWSSQRASHAPCHRRRR
ncbi:hypothetical protein [Sorangium sp. So ce1078]|uniref:hypothetical protein n=1 Tax=Sorangium sp. So ce1078 TaxID=3133329 RepID=UPI003F617C0D